MTFSETVFRNSIYGFVAQIAVKTISFIFSVFVIRNLGAETFGQYTAVLAFGTIFAILSDLGLGLYTTREIARLRNQEEGIGKIGSLVGNVLALRLCLTIITVIVIILAAWLTGRPPIMIGAIAINSLGLFLISIQGSSEAIIVGFEKFGLVSATKIVYQFIFVILGTVVLWLGIGYYGLIIGNLLGLTIFAYLNWRILSGLGFKLGKPDPHFWVPLLRASIPFGLIGFALGLSYKFDTILLNITRSDLETGYYNVAYNLVFSVVMISNVINMALYPSMVAQITTSASLAKIFQRAWRYLLIISLPIATGGWILSEKIINFLYGSDFIFARTALSIVVWVIPLMFSSEFLGYVVVIRNQERLVARAVLVSTGVNILLNLILVPRYGFIAAAIMTVFTEAILVSQHLYSLRDLARQTKWKDVLLKPILAVLIMGSITYLIRDHVHIFVSILVGIISYSIATVSLNVVGKEDVGLFQKILTFRKGNLGSK